MSISLLGPSEYIVLGLSSLLPNPLIQFPRGKGKTKAMKTRVGLQALKHQVSGAQTCSRVQTHVSHTREHERKCCVFILTFRYQGLTNVALVISWKLSGKTFCWYKYAGFRGLLCTFQFTRPHFYNISHCVFILTSHFLTSPLPSLPCYLAPSLFT